MKVCNEQWNDIQFLTDDERDKFVEHTFSCEYHDKILTEFEKSFLPMLNLAFEEHKVANKSLSRVILGEYERLVLPILISIIGLFKAYNERPGKPRKYKECYTFLLSYPFKSKIYIRRVKVSKTVLHTTSFAGLFLLIGVFSFGIIGLVDTATVTKSETHDRNEATIIAEQTVNIQSNDQESKTVSYDRPENYSINSGGPDIQLMQTESEDEEAQIELALKRIESTGNPMFLPTMWAHLGVIRNEFGFRRNPFGGRTYEFHAGMDIEGERGDTVMSPANGVVIKAGWEGGYGNLIEIDHGNGLTTRYGHLSKIEVTVGDNIERGQLIGLIGSTGRSTGPHLHYELRLNDKVINPRRFLPPEPIEVMQLIKK
jgi:murein DD-endopeptidase MepM/ murein hydrolase activator NlpD